MADPVPLAKPEMPAAYLNLPRPTGLAAMRVGERGYMLAADGFVDERCNAWIDPRAKTGPLGSLVLEQKAFVKWERLEAGFKITLNEGWLEDHSWTPAPLTEAAKWLPVIAIAEVR